MPTEITGGVYGGFCMYESLEGPKPSTSNLLRIGADIRERTWVRSASKPYIHTNPYSDEAYTVTQKAHSVHRITPGYGEHHSWGYGQVVDQLRDLARGIADTHQYDHLGTLSNRIYSGLSEVNWDAAMSLAEGRETYRMVGDLLGDIASVAKAAKGNPFSLPKRLPEIRRNLMKAARRGNEAVKATAGRWLQYHYGISPAIRDIESASKYFTDEIAPLPVHVRRRSSMLRPIVDRTQNYPLSYSGTWYQGPGPLVTQGWSRTNMWATVQRKTRPYSPFRELGFDSAARIAWELVPLSFVLDWAVDIGGYIENSLIADSFDIVDCGYSSVCHLHMVHDATLATGGYQTEFYGTPAHAEIEYRRYARVPFSLTPSVVVSNPYNSEFTALNRGITSAALAVQRLLR